jgi:hypothetical protein
LLCSCIGAARRALDAVRTVKYAILPQTLETTELVGGNGMVEMGTFVAILLGTIAGGIVVAIPSLGPLCAGLLCIAIAVSAGSSAARFR